MSATNQNNFNFLSRIAALVGLLSAALYFTGWIYRWAYFGFFHLEVTTLDLAFESFLIVPLQVFFANKLPRIRAAILFLLSTFAFWIIMKMFRLIDRLFLQLQKWCRLRLIRWLKKYSISPGHLLKHPASIWRKTLLQWSPKPGKFSNALVDEAIKVTLVLAVLFWLASNQGLADAQRDAFDQTSTLPVVTLIIPENVLALGRQILR